MVRRFKKSDAEECARIMNTCQKMMPEFNKKQLDFLLNKYKPAYFRRQYPKYFALAYEENGLIKGIGVLLASEIRGLYVDPDFHCKGCGKAIFEKLEEEAKRRKLKKVITKAYFSAVKFYEKMGFRKIKEDDAKRGDIAFPYVLMEKQL